jgi:hypothetical protein
MPAAEPVIELPEQFCRRAETVDVGHADARPAGHHAFWLAAWIDQPPQRGISPGGRL